jgi:hypothetical protein
MTAALLRGVNLNVCRGLSIFLPKRVQSTARHLMTLLMIAAILVGSNRATSSMLRIPYRCNVTLPDNLTSTWQTGVPSKRLGLSPYATMTTPRPVRWPM